MRLNTYLLQTSAIGAGDSDPRIAYSDFARKCHEAKVAVRANARAANKGDRRHRLKQERGMFRLAHGSSIDQDHDRTGIDRAVGTANWLRMIQAESCRR